jgi:hypothetical protein
MRSSRTRCAWPFLATWHGGQSTGAAVTSSSTNWPVKPSCATPSRVLAVVKAAASGEAGNAARLRRARSDRHWRRRSRYGRPAPGRPHRLEGGQRVQGNLVDLGIHIVDPYQGATGVQWALAGEAAPDLNACGAYVPDSRPASPPRRCRATSRPRREPPRWATARRHRDRWRRRRRSMR